VKENAGPVRHPNRERGEKARGSLLVWAACSGLGRGVKKGRGERGRGLGRGLERRKGEGG